MAEADISDALLIALAIWCLPIILAAVLLSEAVRAVGRRRRRRATVVELTPRRPPLDLPPQTAAERELMEQRWRPLIELYREHERKRNEGRL